MDTAASHLGALDILFTCSCIPQFKCHLPGLCLVASYPSGGTCSPPVGLVPGGPHPWWQSQLTMTAHSPAQPWPALGGPGASLWPVTQPGPDRAPCHESLFRLKE